MSDTDKLLLCKHCSHARMELMDKIMTLNGLFPTAYSYKCAKFPREPLEEFSSEDLVIGPKKKNPELTFCDVSRSYSDMCGREGRYWHPKKATGKNLVKYMQKDSHE